MPNQPKTPGIPTRNSSNTTARSGLAHSLNANQPDQASPDAKPSKPDVAIAKMYALLKETSEKQEEKLNVIQRATTAVESKIAEVATCIGDTEASWTFLKMLIKL